MELVSPPANTKPKHDRRETVVLVVILILLLIGVGAGLFLALQPQPLSIQERAQVIEAPICPTDGATCSWSAVTGVDKYSYEIIDQTDGTTVISDTTQETSISFTPVADHTYKCIVRAVNQCGESASQSAVNTCVGVTTPTPTEVPTETPTPLETETPTPTETPIPTETPEPTPTEILTETPTPVYISEETVTEEITNTPVPTRVIIREIQPTATPILTSTPTPTTFPVTPTSVPPKSGANTGVLFMVVSAVILVSLMLVF